MSERIAVTGVGIVSALGSDAPTTFERLIAGECAFQPVTLFDVSGQRSRLAAEIDDLSVTDVAPRGEAEHWSRSDALAVLAAREALASAGLEPGRQSLSLAIGATTGGMFEAESVLASLDNGGATEASARRLLSYPLSTSSERIARALGPIERATTICSACSSGSVAIVQAAAWLVSGHAQRALAGGTDGLCLLTFTGFNALGAVDPVGCRPFDRQRAGLTLGEAAAFVVLERETTARSRGARVMGWLSGWSLGAEAHHITQPEESGATAARLIAEALHRAGLSAGDLDYVNAHGTGTVHNDAMEARALGAVLGSRASRVRVSSSKGQLGHTLGAAGALEAALTVMALERGIAPPTGGLTDPDPALTLRHVIGRGESAELRTALSNSFGFGGAGSVLAFEHAAAPDRRRPAPARMGLVITGAASIGPLGVLENGDNARYAVGPTPPGAEVESPSLVLDPLEQLEPARSRRFDRTVALVTLGAERALRSAGLRPEGAGLIHGSAFGNVKRSVEFLKRVFDRGARHASPAEFPHLVPSAPSGNASIYLGLTGPVLSVSDLATSAEAAFCCAATLEQLGTGEPMIAGAAAVRDPIVTRVLGPLCAAEERSMEAGEGAAWLVLEGDEAAARRGARVLGRLAYWAAVWGTPEQALAGLPAARVADRALVVLGRPNSALERALEASAWQSVARFDVTRFSGRHEATGAFALCAACGLLERGQASEVLVCSAARGRAYAALLRAAEGDPASSHGEGSS